MKTLSKIKKIIHRCAPKRIISFYHLILVFTGAVFYRFPSRKIKVIGVTGTSGKSTVVEFIAQILNSTGHKAASSSSIQFKIGKNIQRNELKMTMPGRWHIQRFLFKAVKEKCEYVILEVTSEGISQHRHRFIDFDTLVFTNLSPEHIERHGGFENYRKTKGLLFASLSKSNKKTKTIIANLDDEQADYFLSFKADQKIGFGKKKQELPGIYLEEMALSPSGSSFVFNGQKIKWSLLGEFNILNGLAAIATVSAHGIDLQKAASALSNINSIPGRMELIMENPFAVIVDYAHTPKSLKEVYKTVREGLKGKMILVLGSCGGGRDLWKRPVFGKLAGEYGDIIILTNEDPYDENPASIIEQIDAGISKEFSGKRFLILDRAKAIKKALNLAQSGDVIVITGKGSESVICWANGNKTPWDDREMVKNLWSEINL